MDLTQNESTLQVRDSELSLVQRVVGVADRLSDRRFDERLILEPVVDSGRSPIQRLLHRQLRIPASLIVDPWDAVQLSE